ncbi:MAG TPA: TolC family protein [Spirochaetota bacterium]|nr:TolC family protein [Spirochaetota bacterium]HPV40583.1 TolC family protein [Spirochaetota bacterium]
MRYLFVMIVLLMGAAAFSDPAVLVELQKITLEENPRIKAMKAEAQMMKKRIPQSVALEDPKLKLGINNLSVKNPSFTKEDMTTKEIGVSQMIPLGRLPYQNKIARQEYEKAMIKLKAEKVETLHMLRMNYYELLYTGSSIGILEDIKRQIRLVIDSEVAATKAGTGSLANVIKAKIEYNMIDEEIINLKQKQREVQQNIYYLAGNSVKIPPAALSEPDFREIAAEAVRKEVAASNPELKMLALDVEISKNEIALKNSEYAPELELGLSYMQRQDGKRQNSFDTMLGMGGPSVVYKSEKMKRDDMISAMATFSIPFWFWQKNIPMVDEMKKKNETARNLYRDALNKMNARAETLVGQLSRWRDLYKLYNERLIPQTELVLETNLARYRTSTVEFMPVVDSVRMLLRYRKERIMAVKEYLASYSELNAMMGVEVLE